jgi:hypothetical protein
LICSLMSASKGPMQICIRRSLNIEHEILLVCSYSSSAT